MFSCLIPTDHEKFDIDGIWGLKDLAVPKVQDKGKGRRGDTESWDLNVGKSYYSRHGNSGAHIILLKSSH